MGGCLLVVGYGLGFGLSGLLGLCIGSHQHCGAHLGTVLTDLRNHLIMIISHEQLLHTRPLQKRLVLLHLFGIGVLPLAVGIFGVEVVFFGWDEGSNEFFLEEFFPWKAFEPEVIFQILWSILTEPVGRFT